MQSHCCSSLFCSKVSKFNFSTTFIVCAYSNLRMFFHLTTSKSDVIPRVQNWCSQKRPWMINGEYLNWDSKQYGSKKWLRPVNSEHLAHLMHWHTSKKKPDVPIKFHHSQDPAIHLLVMFWFMFSARIKLFGKHFNIFCLFESILIVFSILVIIWNAEYRSPIRRFMNNWFLSRRANNFPGLSTQDYSLEQADDYKHLSSMDDLETIWFKDMTPDPWIRNIWFISCIDTLAKNPRCSNKVSSLTRSGHSSSSNVLIHVLGAY